MNKRKALTVLLASRVHRAWRLLLGDARRLTAQFLPRHTSSARPTSTSSTTWRQGSPASCVSWGPGCCLARSRNASATRRTRYVWREAVSMTTVSSPVNSLSGPLPVNCADPVTARQVRLAPSRKRRALASRIPRVLLPGRPYRGPAVPVCGPVRVNCLLESGGQRGVAEASGIAGVVLGLLGLYDHRLFCSPCSSLDGVNRADPR